MLDACPWTYAPIHEQPTDLSGRRNVELVLRRAVPDADVASALQRHQRV
jgi:hypothetical protein